MKKNILIRSFIFLFAISSCAWGFTLPEKCITSTKIVIPPMINCDFKTAIGLTDSIIKSNKRDPFPYILKLTVLGMRDVDFECTLDSALFLSTSRYTGMLIDSMERCDGKSSYSRMLAGFNKSMYSAFFLRNSMYGPGIQSGFVALDLLKESIALDSTNSEVLFFLGLYDFARAELRTRLWWVLFWYPGDKNRGFERLRLCSKNSVITGTAAALSLSEAYIKEHMLGKADSLLSQLETLFPESRFVLWTRIKYFEAKEDPEKAAALYEQLAESYQKTTEGRYNYFVTKNKAAHMHHDAGNRAAANSLCNELLKEPDMEKYKSLKKDTQRLLERMQNGEG
jgi:tetratricopeptide (TPR) repeat protein